MRKASFALRFRIKIRENLGVLDFGLKREREKKGKLYFVCSKRKQNISGKRNLERERERLKGYREIGVKDWIL